MWIFELEVAMKTGFRLGEFELTWLNGGRFELDGGAMFGVVPKVLWQKRYQSDESNYIPMNAWPIMVKANGKLILIETGLGNKLTDKQKDIFRVREEWRVPQDLEASGLSRGDIDFVILTHFDFDHAGGLSMRDNSGKLTLTFPNAKYIIQRTEWEDVLAPNKRSINTFWPINYEIVKDSRNLELVDGDAEVTEGVAVKHTGGHNRGHQIVLLASKGQVAFHLADLLPTHAHFNPLWVMAYDNYPIDAIAQKEKWEARGIEENAWFTFYHDPFVRACRFNEKGEMTEKLI
jgi:glyoxylase-like metal-dependent hydrolase (beta-lactamase superfamily II)